MTNQCYLVRHAQWRCDEKDPVKQHLTYSGIRNAVKTARSLNKEISSENVNVYSSAVERVILTANIIVKVLKKHGKKVNLETTSELGEYFGNDFMSSDYDKNESYKNLRKKLENSEYPVVAISHDNVICELNPDHKDVNYCGVIPIELNKIPTEMNPSWGDL